LFSGQRLFGRRLAFDPRRAWNTVAAETLILESPGDHTSVLESPNVALLANALKSAFDEKKQGDKI
jgi:thioesterase domain-containing protein